MQMDDNVVRAEKLGGIIINKKKYKAPKQKMFFRPQKVSLKKKARSKNVVSSSQSNVLSQMVGGEETIKSNRLD